MTTSSNDRDGPDSKALPDPKAAPGSTAQPEQTAKPAAGRAGQAALLAGFAALAASNVAGVTPANATAGVAPDRAYLEALLHGSWTQPPDLNARRLPQAQPDPAAEQFNQAAAFNDSFNPHPTPYHDQRYGDSAFGDRR